MTRSLFLSIVTMALMSCSTEMTVPDNGISLIESNPVIWQIQEYDEGLGTWVEAEQLYPDRLIRIFGNNLDDVASVSMHATEIESVDFQFHISNQIELLLPIDIKAASVVNENIANKLILLDKDGSTLMEYAIPIYGTRNTENCIVVDSSITHQYIDGFGGMNTKWQSSSLSESELETLFGELGLNILRVRISPKGEQDWAQIVTTVKKARELGATILATPWSPPATAKSNSNLKGGKLSDPASYATHLIDFVNYMKSEGAQIDILSIQNEPDIDDTSESCIWTGEELATFIEEYGSVLSATGVKLLAAEASKFQKSYTDPILNNASACSQIDYIGGHIYGGGLQAYPDAATAGNQVWMTEHLRNQAWASDGSLISQNALLTENIAIANEIQQCMLADFSAYLWWYLRRSYSMMLDDGTLTHRAYILSLFAKAATGRTRVEAVMPDWVDSEVTATAYVNNQNQASILVINPTSFTINDLGAYYSPSSSSTATLITSSLNPDDEAEIASSEIKVEDGINLPPFSINAILLN